MPWCPKCGAEYVKGVGKCPDCGVALRHDPPPDKVPASEKDLVVVWQVSDPNEAEACVGLLKSRGIKAMIRDKEGSLRSLWGVTVFPDRNIDIYVRKQDAKAALKVLEEWEG